MQGMTGACFYMMSRKKEAESGLVYPVYLILQIGIHHVAYKQDGSG
jgi:hypothetical protein